MVQPTQCAPGSNTDKFGTCQSTARTTKPPKYITTSKWKDDTNPYTLGHNWQQQMGSFVYRLPQRLVNCQHMAEFAKQISLIQGNGYTLHTGPEKPNLYTANTATATTGILHYGTQKIQSLT